MAEEYDKSDFIKTAAAFDRPNNRPRPAQNGDGAKVVQPTPQLLKERQGPSAILVSMRQKGNPILNHIKSLPWEYSDIPCDYVLGLTTCALFLSLKYHRLHPEYIYGRIQKLGKLYNLRILLTMVDIENHETALQELSKTSMINNLTIILAWSAQEAGRYIELFKSFEHANPSAIRARQAETWQESLTEFVTTPRNINKTDAASLISNFGTLRAGVNAESEELALIPGWGEKKIKSWYTTVREPFRVKRSTKHTAQLMRQESSMASVNDQDEQVYDHPAARAVPIASVKPNLSRDSSSADAQSMMNTTHISKRSRLDESYLIDDMDDLDEQDMLAALDQSSVSEQRPAAAPIEQDVSEQADAGLSEGIAAALARYRNMA